MGPIFTNNSTFGDVVKWGLSFADSVIPVLATLALVLFFVGVVRYVYHSGDAHGKGADKEILIWGLIALFVIFSVWGILRILRNTFLGGA